MTISLHRVRYYAYHGVMPQEQVVGADYELTLSVDIPYSAAACEQDSLEGTLNYAELYALASREMAVPSQLLEHVVGRICRAVLTEFGQAERVTCQLTKLNPPLGAACGGASVKLTQERY